MHLDRNGKRSGASPDRRKLRDSERNVLPGNGPAVSHLSYRHSELGLRNPRGSAAAPPHRLGAEVFVIISGVGKGAAGSITQESLLHGQSCPFYSL